MPGSGVERGGRPRVNRWDVSAVFVETSAIEPVDPFGGGDLDLVHGAPGPLGPDQLGLVEPVDGLSQRVVERRADSADRGQDAGLGETLTSPVLS